MSNILTFDGRPTGAAAADDEDVRISNLLVAVGERVRAARDRKGISRRALSEMSGVSQRYLAQLEAGNGNISIALLMRIANALDVHIQWLVMDDDPWTSEHGAIALMLPGATRDQRERILEILDPVNPALKRASRIALIGLRGAGKSTLGRLAADKLSVPFVELNDEIEVASGIPVHEVIALYGQEGYRQLEYQALERVVATRDEVVLAVAGGIVSQPETFNYLLRNYHTIWLKARPEEHMARVRGQGDERPMAGHPEAMAELRSILKSREKLYARAAASVDTSGIHLDESLERVVTAIRGNGFLSPGTGGA